MNQVREESGIIKVKEIIKMFFRALTVNDDYIADPEEEIKRSGNEELIKSTARIKSLEAMYKETELSKNKIRNHLKDINRNQEVKSPKISNVTIHTTERETTEKKIDDNEMEL